MDNILYYGDNLDILRRYVAAESVDLVYLDPPFKSDQNYNVLFQERDGAKAASQIRAFEDTWTWDQEDEGVYAELVTAGGKVADCLEAFRRFLGPCDMLAYLVMMAPRLCELRRVMKPTASIYLHCDPTASHYLKLLMDAVFGVRFCRGEIIWQRSSAHNDTSQGLKQPGKIHDTILFYTKEATWQWNPVFTAYTDDYVQRRFRNCDARGHYKDADLTAAKPGGDTSYSWRVKRRTGKEWQSDLTNEWQSPHEGWEYRDVRPSHGRFWAYSYDNMRRYAEDDKLHYFGTGMPRLKQYRSEMAGVALQDMWTDISPINSQAAERLGYPTQKPVALLERIIQASSNPGDLVLDPFCGCGTTIEAAQKLGRRWIGIDITHLAITLMKQRLKDAFGIEPVTLDKGKASGAKGETASTSPDTDTSTITRTTTRTSESTPDMADTAGEYAPEGKAGGAPVTTVRPDARLPFRVIGEPVSVPDAADLAASDPYQFQWWALGLVGARPVEQKKGADKGIDGKIVFQGDGAGKFESVILSVKAGHVTANHVRDLRGVVEREKAAIGVLISMEDATGPMRTEAVTAGFYESATWGRKYPKIQLLTVAELLDGREIEMPPRRQVDATFRKAPRARVKPAGSQPELL